MKYLVSVTVLVFTISLFFIEGFAQEPVTQYVIAKSGLKMREAPDLSGKEIILITYNKPVKFIERKDEYVKIGGVSGRWMKVEYEGRTGWIFGGFVSWQEASMSMPSEFFGYWVKDNTKQNSMEYFFDINTMGITLIYGRDATTHTSWFVQKWTLQGNEYSIEFTNNDNETKIFKIINDARAKELRITEEGSSNTITLVRKN